MTALIKANEKDIPQIQELAARSWHAAYEHLLSPAQITYMLDTMYSSAELSRQLRSNTYHYYLILENGSAAGFMGFETAYEADTTKLHRIYLLAEYTGKGLGKMSIDFLKKRSLELGDHRIILNVNKGNSARKIYESQGFRVYKEAVFDIGNNFVMDDYLMEFRSTP